ncbi:MAG: hypothetical protein M0Q47_02435 [Methanothrix sp.]|uniref:hypothetical protein n=1 Tax=Methanothrix sp. TaxID=90426 RepID=UPI0025DA773A|nr:hypothetical protein [Methanothrix sp.]MCK9405257.1 hypothetical protein [Methanothrix sp.]
MKSPSFRVVSRTASPGELRLSRNRMKAESFAPITFDHFSLGEILDSPDDSTE